MQPESITTAIQAPTTTPVPTHSLADTMDSCCKELELTAELAMCLNEAQAIEAIKEAELHHTTAACILQQTQGKTC